MRYETVKPFTGTIRGKRPKPKNSQIHIPEGVIWECNKKASFIKDEVILHRINSVNLRPSAVLPYVGIKAGDFDSCLKPLG